MWNIILLRILCFLVGMHPMSVRGTFLTHSDTRRYEVSKKYTASGILPLPPHLLSSVMNGFTLPPHTIWSHYLLILKNQIYNTNTDTGWGRGGGEDVKESIRSSREEVYTQRIHVTPQRAWKRARWKQQLPLLTVFSLILCPWVIVQKIIEA